MRRAVWLLVGVVAGLAIACGSGGPSPGTCGGAGGQCVEPEFCRTVRNDGPNPCGENSRLVCCVTTRDGGSRD
jgi:hypothetical protein